MEVLSEAAELAMAGDEGANPGADDDYHAQRGGLPSDDEEGPGDPEEDEDSLPPGDLDAAGATMDEPAAETVPAEAEATSAAAAPPLPAALETLKAEELKEHLRWRACSTSGNKAQLRERLEQAIKDGVSVLESLGARAGRGSGAQAGEIQGWEALDSSKVSRPTYDGEDKFVPKASLGFTPQTHPFEYMSAYYPKSIRELEVENSERYRHHLAANFTEIYPNAKRMDMKTNSLAHAILICQGLHPVPSQRGTLFRRSFAYKGTRAADMLSKTRWLEWKAFFHISHPGHAPVYGTRAWDELHKVRPMLYAYLKACVDNIVAGRRFSIDEITIGFQGHHARLKIRCGKFKRAGDGFQADAIVLEGGYVLFLVFRGDNTIPTFNKEFSPLHNRCLLLLSKLLRDGHTGWWDNLYPSLPVIRSIATGGEYTATVPAGPSAGTSQTIVVHKTGMSGTARVNRGVPAQCRQPNPKTDRISKSKLEAIKAKPLEERMKFAMTTTEPRVICASVFDNGPVHMLDTIHTEVKPITIFKQRWDPASKKLVQKPIRLMNLVAAYNPGMDEVDVRDHLGHSYHFDGHFWHDRKWWMPIFKELFKSSCDQGYVVYKRVCEIAEAKRQEELAAGPASPTRAAQRVHARAKPIKAMTHLDFMEKIAEGFVIEAYNSTKAAECDCISFRAYNLQMLERAIAEMRGAAPPSSGAIPTPRTATQNGMAGGKAQKRKFEVCEQTCLLGPFDLVHVSIAAARARRSTLTRTGASAPSASIRPTIRTRASKEMWP